VEIALLRPIYQVSLVLLVILPVTPVTPLKVVINVRETKFNHLQIFKYASAHPLDSLILALIGAQHAL
jgi:hypothetical protein